MNPKDCAIAIGIPLSLADLSRDWVRPDTEFTRVLVKQSLGTDNPADAWQLGYRDLCEQVQRVIRYVQMLGVTVVENATLRDLEHLLTKFSVVTTVAHSPFSLLDLKDVLQPERLLSAFGDAASPTSEAGHEVLRHLVKIEMIREARSLPALVKALNQQLEKTRQFFHERISDVSERDLPSAYERSTRHGGITPLHLVEALPGAFRSPPVLELRDGLHSFEAIVSAIPPTYSGVIDFLACSALWFCESLRRARVGCRSILCAKQLVFSEEWMPIYLATIRQISCRPMPFEEARQLVHRALIGILNTDHKNPNAS